MIKKTKRQHQLWTEWKSIQDMKSIAPKLEAFLKQPMAGRWYYTYSNDKGMAVGLAKLQDTMSIGWIFGGKNKKKWMWETCTANEELELRRFSTQKAAENEIYKFLS